MIKNLSSVSQCLDRQARVAERRARLRLSGNLAGYAVRYSGFDPSRDRGGTAIVKSKVFYLCFAASCLKGLADIVSDAEDAISRTGEMFSIQSQQLISQSVGNGNGAGAHRFCIHAFDRNGFSEQVDVTPTQTKDLSCPHPGVQGADYYASQAWLAVQQQRHFFFPTQNPLPRHFIGHRNQTIAIVKGRTFDPSHSDRSFEHSSKQSHFPVDARDLSLPPILSLSRSFKAQCFVILEIVVRYAREALWAKERCERRQMKERRFITTHPGDFASIDVDGLNDVSLPKYIRQVIKGAARACAQRFAPERYSQVALTALARFCFGSAGAPEGMPLSISACVRGLCVNADNLLAILLNRALNNRKSSLPHLISTLVSAFSENVRPDGALNSTDRLAKATRMAVNFPLLAGAMRYNRWIVDQASDSSQNWANKGDKGATKSESRLSSTLAAVLVQSVRTPDCGSGGRGFEPHIPPQLIEGSRLYGVGLFSFAP